MKTSPKFLNLTKAQRKGMIWTLALFLIAHLGIVYFPINTQKDNKPLQLDSLAQVKIDAVVTQKQLIVKDTIYPFNPNYISNFKAYQLGISMDVVYRIRAYRNAGKYINSEKAFQQIAQLSNEELLRLRPYLKCPNRFQLKRKNQKRNA